MKIFSSIFISLFFYCIAYSQNFAPDDLLGKWMTSEKESIIEIYKKGDIYLGKIVWLKEPNENGKPKLDKNNPNESKRSIPLKGLIMLKDFEWDEDNEWDDGSVYDPKSGNTYDGTITMEKKDEIFLRGYIGISLFGRTTTWTRVKK